jgi:DNA-binding CsgD family transcriptional regulator
MQPLTDREREVLRLRYGLDLERDLSLAEIGRRFSLSRERIRQTERRAIAKMRAARETAAGPPCSGLPELLAHIRLNRLGSFLPTQAAQVM